MSVEYEIASVMFRLHDIDRDNLMSQGEFLTMSRWILGFAAENVILEYTLAQIHSIGFDEELQMYLSKGELKLRTHMGLEVVRHFCLRIESC